MKTGLIKYFAENPVAANLLMLFLIIGGLLTSLQLPVRPLPEIDLRKITITVESPNSSTLEVQEDISRRLEESLVGLEGAARIVTEAMEGRSVTVIELDTLANANAVLANVENSIDGIDNFPSGNAEFPKIEINMLSFEVMTIAVSSQILSEDALHIAADGVYNALLSLPSVSKIRTLGAREREIAIEMNEEDLRRHNLTISDVANAVRRASINLSFGKLQTEAGDLTLHVVSKKERGSEFANIPVISRRDGTDLRLSDVATIRDGFVSDRILSEIDGIPVVLLRIEVAEAQSFTRTAESIGNWLADYKPPPGVTVSIWSDRAAPISDRFSNIVDNALIGIILVFICLLIFFDLRSAVWVAVGIPLSFLGALMLFPIAGLTLNMGTLLAFFLLIGIVVDDALVVGESIEAARDRGDRGVEAAISGAHAVFAPITIGAITTVLAFVPFLFMMVEVYQVLQVFFYVVLFVLLISLVEAFCILPSHLSHDVKWSLSPLKNLQEWGRDQLDRLCDVVVVPAVSWSIRNIFLTFAISLAFMAAAAWLIRSENVKVVLLDKYASVSNTITAELQLPVGASFNASAAAAERFVKAAQMINTQLPGTSIRSISVRVGESGDRMASNSGATNPVRHHLAAITLALHDRPVRLASHEDIERAWRNNVGSIADIENVAIQTTGIRFRPTVAYALVHDDPKVLKQAASELRSFMENIPGLYGLTDSLEPGKRHFQIELTPEGEAAGLSPAMVSKQLRSSFHGLEAQRIQRGRHEIKVMVRYPEERRQSIRALSSEKIKIAGGQEIPLSTAAIVTEKSEANKLIHIDGRPAARVSAFADQVDITPIQARRMISEEFLTSLLEKHPGLIVSFDLGARNEQTTLKILSFLVPLVLIAIYALMASFLRSYWKPLIIIVGVPIAAAGAVFGHWLLGWNLSVISICGMIGAFGVLVNDALVLLDRYNSYRRDKAHLPAIAAASAATQDRFRAVFLTSLTTILGLSPLLYERSDDLLFLVPFSVSILGGLAAATAFTLFALPALVMVVDGRSE